MRQSDSIIYPRSPREVMCGWVHLPRYVDKIRLHLVGRLGKDYQENFGKGFDGFRLEAAGVVHDDFIEVVRNTICDGQVTDWVRKHVNRTEAQKLTFREMVFSRGSQNDEQRARLAMRKKEIGISDRNEIQTFVDFIDADEGRL